MKAQHAILLLFSHAALLGGGYAIHRSLAPAPPAPAVPPPPPPVVEAPKKPRDFSAGGHYGAGDAPWTATECRKAWRALKGAPLPPEQLALLRHQILREWLAKDPRAALIAWSDEETLASADVNNAYNSFAEGHEEELLDSIASGDFGVNSGAILKFWSNWGRRKPGLVLDLATKIPADLRARILQDVFKEKLEQPVMDDCIAKAAAMTDPKLKEEAWSAILSGMMKDPAPGGGGDRAHEMLAREDIPPAARTMALAAFAERLALLSKNPAVTLQEYAKLSPADQTVVAPLFMEQAARKSYANPEAVTCAVSALAAQGQWELIAAKGPAAIDQMFSAAKPSPQAVSRWALGLPERQECVAVYRRAVAARFRENLTASSEWLASIPEGWHRDQAYAQLAMSADGHHKNAAARDEAIAAIADPAIRQELEQWRTSEAKAK